MTKTKSLPRFAELAIRLGVVPKNTDAVSALMAWAAVVSDFEVKTRAQWLISERHGKPAQPYLEYRDTETVLMQMAPEELAALRKRIKEKQ